MLTVHKIIRGLQTKKLWIEKNIKLVQISRLRMNSDDPIIRLAFLNEFQSRFALTAGSRKGALLLFTSMQ